MGTNLVLPEIEGLVKASYSFIVKGLVISGILKVQLNDNFRETLHSEWEWGTVAPLLFSVTTQEFMQARLHQVHSG